MVCGYACSHVAVCVGKCVERHRVGFKRVTEVLHCIIEGGAFVCMLLNVVAIPPSFRLQFLFLDGGCIAVAQNLGRSSRYI